MIIVTHDVHGARRVGDRFAVLDQGSLAALGKPEELEDHENETVRRLVREEYMWNRYVGVGIFASWAWRCLHWLIFLIGNQHSVFAKHIELLLNSRTSMVSPKARKSGLQASTRAKSRKSVFRIALGRLSPQAAN